MSIVQLPFQLTGSPGLLPTQKFMVSTDDLATVTTAGYVNTYNLEANPLSPSDIVFMLYSFNQQTQSGSFGIFQVSIASATGIITLVNIGIIPALPTIANHIAVYTNTSGALGEDATPAINAGSIQAGLASGTAGGFVSYPATTSEGYLQVSATNNAGGNFNTIVTNATPIAQNQTISIPDSGAATASFLLSNSGAAGQTVAASTASATPGTIRSLRGLMTESNTTMTTGNVVGVRGEVDMVGASGGFVYGAQGKVIPTGTLSGSSWTAGVFGQFDLSNPAVINGGQLAAIWGDWGATGATATSMTGARGFAFTNTTANILNAQMYLYGPATQLLELDDNQAGYGATYFVPAGTSAGSAGDTSKCNATQVLKISVNGTAYYIPLFAQNS